MSEVNILAVKIDAVYPHPNADKLDIIIIGAYQTCDAKGKHQMGDIVAHFPPDILIPLKIATELGITNYLKDAIYPGEAEKTKCRVGAIRLRGVASFGFVLPVQAEVGADLTERFHGVKYEPPEHAWFNGGDNAKGDVRFHTYTDIQNYRNPRYHNALLEGIPVRLTEKCHGSNSRVGIIDGKYMCGSHNCAKKETIDGEPTRSIYWKPLTDNMKDMLRCISADEQNVIAFGEIYGSKVQFMDYGVFGSDGYALFDISVNGQYLNWEEVVYYATRFCVPLVPLLYKGPFNHELVNHLVDGQTIIGDLVHMRSKFTGREGVVITPLTESFSDVLGGRLILKAISVDYLECRKSDSH